MRMVERAICVPTSPPVSAIDAQTVMISSFFANLGVVTSTSSLTTSTSDETSPRSASTRTTAEDVRHLRDFSAEIPYLKAIREDYLRWRSGGPTGLKGNIDSSSSLQEMIKELEDAADKNKVHQSADDPEDVFIWRKQTRDTNMYRKQYAKWRKGNSEGARSTTLGLSPDARRDNRALF